MVLQLQLKPRICADALAIDFKDDWHRDDGDADETEQRIAPAEP